jgi:hypothetical protein
MNPERSEICTCDPRRLEVGGTDQGCPVHDQLVGEPYVETGFLR